MQLCQLLRIVFLLNCSILLLFIQLELLMHPNILFLFQSLRYWISRFEHFLSQISSDIILFYAPTYLTVENPHTRRPLLASECINPIIHINFNKSEPKKILKMTRGQIKPMLLRVSFEMRLRKQYFTWAPKTICCCWCCCYIIPLCHAL